MATYLDRILEAHRAAVAADLRPIGALIDRAVAQPPVRPFGAALRGTGSLAVIAEIKRRSPSKGDLNIALDASELARSYAAGGAAALSVLTDGEFFGGAPADLQAAKAAVDLPVLRKDFTVSALDVADARLMGADCVLLIAAALEPVELKDLHALAVELGLDVLVEIHDEHELAIALDVGASIVGVNQRDLITFAVDHERALRMAGLIPHDVVRVAESGVRDADDAGALAAAGYDAILVGETLVTAADAAATIRTFKGDH
ncbi:MAG: indole-3-glycerol phosphate synthase [Acidimicrobiaceae bacterium]|nr:indole-3-glycerol phosphate synthase [Acidimicrobiaceae bacterium]